MIQVNVGLHFRWWPSRTHILVLHEPLVAAIGSPASVAERPLQPGDAAAAATGSLGSGEMAGAVAEGGAAGGDRNRVCLKIAVLRGRTCVAR